MRYILLHGVTYRYTQVDQLPPSLLFPESAAIEVLKPPRILTTVLSPFEPKVRRYTRYTSYTRYTLVTLVTLVTDVTDGTDVTAVT